MDYMAIEQNVYKPVNDLEILCNYIEKNKPIATQKGDLPTKACFELNQLISRKEDEAKPTNRQEK